MREHVNRLWAAALEKPWLAALVVAGVYLLISLVLLAEGGRDDGARTLPDQGPDALEVALTPLSALSVFLATWAVLALMRRRPLGGVREGEGATAGSRRGASRAGRARSAGARPPSGPTGR